MNILINYSKYIKSWLTNGNGRSIKDIFNLDETALFYKLLPNRTLADGPVSGKKVKHCVKSVDEKNEIIMPDQQEFHWN